jgi:alkylation response protein AidB-like acyl-CoA dehydrogenase
MNFDFVDMERDLREKIKGLFDPDAKAALSLLETGDISRAREVLLNALIRLAQVGYLTLGLDEGKDNVTLKVAQESLAAVSPSVYLSVEVSARIFGRLLSVYATFEQKAEILTALTDGRIIGAVGLTEEGMSIDNPMDTAGIRDRDGFRVSGSKGYVVNAPVADWIAVAGRVSGEAEGNAAIFLVKKASKGLNIGKRHATLGYNGAATSPISLDNCHIPSRYVIGPFEQTEPFLAMRTWEDQILTAAGLGVMQSAFDEALKYAKNHTSGGKPIIAYQEIGFKLAEMLTLLQTAQLLTYRAAWMTETGDREASQLAHCAKVFSSESAEEIASHALQILGQRGYLLGNPAEQGYRNAKFLQIAGTSSEISRMKIGNETLSAVG